MLRGETLKFCTMAVEYDFLVEKLRYVDENPLPIKTGIACAVDMYNFNFFMKEHPVNEQYNGLYQGQQLSDLSLRHDCRYVIKGLVKRTVNVLDCGDPTFYIAVVNTYCQYVLCMHLLRIHYKSLLIFWNIRKANGISLYTQDRLYLLS